MDSFRFNLFGVMQRSGLSRHQLHTPNSVNSEYSPEMCPETYRNSNVSTTKLSINSLCRTGPNLKITIKTEYKKNSPYRK